MYVEGDNDFVQSKLERKSDAINKINSPADPVYQLHRRKNCDNDNRRSKRQLGAYQTGNWRGIVAKNSL